MPGVVDPDWEYEYDESMTEDFYFTLDLTTHIPDALRTVNEYRQRPRRKDPKIFPRPRSGPGAATGQDGDDQEIESVDDTTPHQTSNSRAEPSQYSKGDTGPEIQFLDLHTEQPLIKLDERIYSCYWMNDLGTQIYIARPGATARPLRPGLVLDVLGQSQARLLAKRVTVKRRQGVPDADARGSSSVNAINIDDEEEDEEENGYVGIDEENPPMTEPVDPVQPPDPLKVPRERVTSSALRQQASFMERLSAIKIKKGEHDRVPLFSLKGYRPELVAGAEQMRVSAFSSEDRDSEFESRGGRKRRASEAEQTDEEAENDIVESRKKSNIGHEPDSGAMHVHDTPPGADTSALPSSLSDDETATTIPTAASVFNSEETSDVYAGVENESEQTGREKVS